jgi:protoporphyrinogen/coproporphyrinogen III oxidase
MKKKRIIILGAGISGLSAAWYLSKIEPQYECLILEKENRVGGWLETEASDGFLFETGPRVFKVSRNQSFLELAYELGLKNEIILSSPQAHDRYLWMKGNMQKVPGSPLDLLFSSFTYPLLKALATEWKRPVKDSEESIWDFVCRRFGRAIAENLFDPLVLGIYGGDIRKLSVKACFPTLKKWELEKGSVTRGLLSTWRTRTKSEHQMPGSSLFTFKEGMGSFLMALMRQLPASVHLNQQVQSIRLKGGQMEVKTQNAVWTGDFVFCALPARRAACLLEEWQPEAASKLKEIPYQPITSVNIGFEEDVLPLSAFGYLVPSSQKEKILGVIFDSKAFPQQNTMPSQTRLTLMISGASQSESELMEEVYRSLEVHLRISSPPYRIQVKRMKEAIPQYLLAHQEKIAMIESSLKKSLPNFYLLGNYLHGVSVNDCLEQSKRQCSALHAEAAV